MVIEHDRDLAALSRWVKTTHEARVPIWAQLNHLGRQSNPLALGHTPVAPSPVPLSLPGSPTPRALTGPQIENIVDRFVTAAQVCEAAGFDGVLNISWSTDQLHRLGAGLEPDLNRGRLATTLAMLRRNGTASLRPKRGIR